MAEPADGLAIINSALRHGKAFIKKMVPMPPKLAPCEHWVLPEYMQEEDKKRKSVHGDKNGNLVTNEIQ